MTVRMAISLTLLLGIVLAGLAGASMSLSMIERVQEQRFASVTAGLREQLETDLLIGLDLANNERAQPLLEAAVAHTPMLASIEIDSDSGKVLFDSDRALRGQQVPDEWRRAASAHPGAWHIGRQDEHILGEPLTNSFGENVGYLVLTHAGPGEDERHLFPKPVPYMAAGAALLSLLIGWFMARGARSRRLADLARLQSPSRMAARDALEHAAQILIEAREALVAVDNDARQIAGIDA
jgi:hypothetical protein